MKKIHPAFIVIGAILMVTIIFFSYPFILDWISSASRKRAYLIEKPHRELVEKTERLGREIETLEAYQKALKERKGR